MSTNNNEVTSNNVNGNSPASPTPAIGELQPAGIGNINLESLRKLYGNGYGTSGYGIINATPDTGKTSVLKLETWMNESQKGESDPNTLMDEGIIILQEGFADYNSLKHLFGQYDAKWAIKLGQILRQQKELVRKEKLEWGAWAASELPFIGKRTREKFMTLAKRTDCHKYSFLGVDRLDILCGATKDAGNEDEKDHIGVFMAEHEIHFDPTQEFDPQEFKIQVDTALNRARLIKNDLPADLVYVRALTVAGKDINGSVIKKMKDVKECGGDPAAHLKNLTLTSGQDSDDTKTTVADFNTLSNRLIKTIDYLIKDKEEEIVKVDPETFIKLLKKLAALHKFTAIDLKSEQAA